MAFLEGEKLSGLQTFSWRKFPFRFRYVSFWLLGWFDLCICNGSFFSICAYLLCSSLQKHCRKSWISISKDFDDDIMKKTSHISLDYTRHSRIYFDTFSVVFANRERVWIFRQFRKKQQQQHLIELLGTFFLCSKIVCNQQYISSDDRITIAYKNHFLVLIHRQFWAHGSDVCIKSNRKCKSSCALVK